MRKWVIIFLLIIGIGTVMIYFFIPSTVPISKTVYVKSHSDVAYRNLSEENMWLKWWPADSTTKNITPVPPQSKFVYENSTYSIVHKEIDAIDILIESNGDTLNSRILIIPLRKDSTALYWSCVKQTGYNPFRKIQYYQQAKSIKENMEKILKSLQSHLAKKENLYGVPIERGTVTDTLLVSSKVLLDHYPTTSEVYDLVTKLKQYIVREEGKETNYPMLHILQTDSNHVQMMVAIPVNKQLRDAGDFVFKRMVPGNILVATIKGGRHTVDKAFSEMELYIKDNQLTPPAIPFQSLVTDRVNEPDSNKWITRIYYPIL